MDAPTSSPADVFFSVLWGCDLVLCFWVSLWSSSSCHVVIGAEVVFPQYCRNACQDVSVLLTTVRVQASETIFERCTNDPVEHDTDLAQYRIHGKVISTPTKCIRFPTLRGFNLSHSSEPGTKCSVVRGLWNAVSLTSRKMLPDTRSP